MSHDDPLYTPDDVFGWMEELLICAAAVLALLVVLLPIAL
jgi:hypothetical protein